MGTHLPPRFAAGYVIVIAGMVLLKDASGQEPARDPGGAASTESSHWGPSFCSTRSDPGDAHFSGTPWTGGIVPYTFSATSPGQQQKILAAMAILSSVADIQFVPRTSEPRYITIRNDPNCMSSSSNCIGMCANNIVTICESHWDHPGLLMHEMMHALGFWHEQQRPDRDQFVEVHPALMNNSNYVIQHPPAGNMHGVYDFASLMHYDQIEILNGVPVRGLRVRAPYTRAWQYELDNYTLPSPAPSSGDVWALQNLYGGSPPPRAFVLMSPAPDTAVGAGWTPSFSWTASEAATEYRLEVDQSPAFDSPEIDIVTATTAYQHSTPLTEGQLYWWRVTASNARGTAKAYPFRSHTVYTAPAFPSLLYVDDSAPANGNGLGWPSALRDLAVAMEIAAASGGLTTEIRVAQGVYTPDFGSRDRARAFLLPDGCAVRGGYAGFGAPDPDARDIELHETTLSGDLDGNDQPGFANIADNSRNVVISVFNPSTTLLEGFTVRAANCDAYGNLPGIGGTIIDGGSPTIRFCRFVGNHAEHGGPGILVIFSPSTSPVIDRCEVSNNRSLVTAPSFFGPGFGGGGMLVQSTGPFAVSNCVFAGNSADASGGAAACRFAHPRFTNCLFADNTAVAGGGALLSASSAQPVLVNCTVVHNSSLGTGGGVAAVPGSAAIVANSIVWGSVPDQYVGAVSVSYSAIQGGASGTGNLSVDPGLEPGTFRLAPHSPCIDAANSSLLPAGISVDLCGNPRYHDDPGTANTGVGSPPVDMGACEFQGATCYANCDGSTIPPILNVNDFICFQQKYAAGDPYANCDGSTTTPVLNVNDFTCFMNAFAAGCS